MIIFNFFFLLPIGPQKLLRLLDAESMRTSLSLMTLILMASGSLLWIFRRFSIPELVKCVLSPALFCTSLQGIPRRIPFARFSPGSCLRLGSTLNLLA